MAYKNSGYIVIITVVHRPKHIILVLKLTLVMDHVMTVLSSN